MQKIGANIIQLNFQLMWTSGLTMLFFSIFGPNNFQTVIDSKKMIEINSELRNKNAYTLKISAQSVK